MNPSFLRRAGRVALLISGLGILVAAAILLILGLQVPRVWATDVWAGGTLQGSSAILQPPFPPLANLDLFDINLTTHAHHFYLLGSDEGGRDLLALTARAAIPSLELVGLVVLVRFVVGLVMGLAMGAGSRLARELGRAFGSVLIGFPYLALAVVVVQAVLPKGRWIAFVVAMTLVGWREIAELVVERIEHVRSQAFATASQSLGTGPLTFFRLHVIPFLRPALGIEIPFQVSAVLVLLAELGYLHVYLGQSLQLANYGGPPTILITKPELGQLLSTARDEILYNHLGIVLVPACAIFVVALGFEIIGTAVRGRTRFVN
jgi:ABC-type dipeptide/oligopeptide/nickel transport system permease subunit